MDKTPNVIDGVMSDSCFTLEQMILHLAADLSTLVAGQNWHGLWKCDWYLNLFSLRAVSSYCSFSASCKCKWGDTNTDAICPCECVCGKGVLQLAFYSINFLTAHFRSWVRVCGLLWWNSYEQPYGPLWVRSYLRLRTGKRWAWLNSNITFY